MRFAEYWTVMCEGQLGPKAVCDHALEVRASTVKNKKAARRRGNTGGMDAAIGGEVFMGDECRNCHYKPNPPSKQARVFSFLQPGSRLGRSKRVA